MAWALARRGVRVAVVERATFPREKVCGDFVEPGGLRILDAMQCREVLRESARLPITSIRAFVRSRVAYRGAIPYYQEQNGLPSHGYIVPRHELDAGLLDRARAASATVYEGAAATTLRREHGVVRVGVRRGDHDLELSGGSSSGPTAPIDGREKRRARARSDRRYIAISQRAYVERCGRRRRSGGLVRRRLVPGYGWMFPMPGGRANVGVGILM